MNFTQRREKFREILAGDRCVHPGSVYDPISVRIAEDLGYEIALLGGSAASLAILGAPDIALITLSELAEQCRRICRASPLPLLVDADHGYGNALNAMRTVQELEAAGIAAVTIEDIVLPRTYGLEDEVPPISMEEMEGKLRASLLGRLDPSLVVVGRVTGLTTLGLEDTLRRITLYEKTGVDAIMVVGVQTRAEMDAICATAKLPLVMSGAGRGELGKIGELGAMGIKVAPQGHVPPLAATLAMQVALKAVYDGAEVKKVPNIADSALMARVTRTADYDRWTQQFLGGA